MITDEEWKSLYDVTNPSEKCPDCGSHGNGCSTKAVKKSQLESDGQNPQKYHFNHIQSST